MTRGVGVAAVLLTLVGTEVIAEVPVPLSPGAKSGVAVASTRCPTFHWTGVEGAEAVNLIVYRVSEEEAESQPEPVLSVSLPGSAYGWTPSLDQCLEAGGRYAWSVRAGGDWSEANLFQVLAIPSVTEVEEAMAVLRHYLGQAKAGVEGVEENLVGSEERAQITAAMTGISPPVPTGGIGALEAHLTVVGEVRTLDTSGEPRLWGRGRPNVSVWGRAVIGGYCSNDSFVQFSLSTSSVDWGSAADACPAGTWVCRLSDTLPCNTNRPDGTEDGQECDGTALDFTSTAHLGWVADSFGDLGRFFAEDNGVQGSLPTCYSLPVWCCGI